MAELLIHDKECNPLIGAKLLNQFLSFNNKTKMEMLIKPIQSV